MAERQGVEIDYCPQCRGIWLDRGELEKIIDRSANLSPAYDQQYPPPGHSENHFYKKKDHHDHDDRHDYRDGYGHRRKKGFLGELFDF
jgi:Zn-finger nucleic acid-binding protein